MARDEQDPGALADEMEQEADRLEDRNKELGDEVQNVRQDWERKRADEGVPGANPRMGDSQDESVASGTDETDSGGPEADERSDSGDAKADERSDSGDAKADERSDSRDAEADERSDQDESEDQTSGQGSDVPPDREAGRD